ncbi:MAG: hypothetical protein KF785_06680 [Gemmatimonadales bacterium]|nr:hypothetical protein [Gemmatimonadales bacterium]
MRRFGLILAISAASGCSDYLGPDRGNPADYAFAQPYLYSSCHRTDAVPTLPNGLSLGLFDVLLIRNDESDAHGAPRSDEVRRIVQAGGTVVHSFNLPLVRAILPAAALPTLRNVVIHGVTEPHQLDTRVIVGFHTTIVPDAVTGRGGTILQAYASFPAVHAIVPDAAIASLRKDNRVQYVESALGIGCLEATAHQTP